MHIPTLLQKIYRPFGFFYYFYCKKYQLRLPVILPTTFILAANHEQTTDPLLLLAALPHKSLPLFFITKKQVLRNRPGWSWLANDFIFYLICSIDTANNTGSYQLALADAIQKAATGNNIAIFPQGKIESPVSFKNYHGGAIYLAEAAQLPILPIKISQKPDKQITIGEAIQVSDLIENNVDIKRYQLAAKRLLEKINNLH